MSLELLHVVLLAIGAFWLGACPFSVWIGRRLLSKDIRAYGDGNPGAANVFKAGNRKLGLLAVFMDAGKGVPFVLMSHSLFALPEMASMVIAICAVMGHAFSPMLGFKGGKAIAVTFGVLIGLTQPDMLIVFTALVVIGFLLLENDAWKVMLGPIGSVVYISANDGSSGQLILMVSILVMMTMKNRKELRTAPKLRRRLAYHHSTREV